MIVTVLEARCRATGSLAIGKMIDLGFCRRNGGGTCIRFVADEMHNRLLLYLRVVLPFPLHLIEGALCCF